MPRKIVLEPEASPVSAGPSRDMSVRVVRPRSASGSGAAPTSTAIVGQIEVGYQVFTADGGEEVGAVRDVYPDGLVVYVENGGDFRVQLAAVEAVHSQKVILTCGKLSRSLRRAIGHAHDAEVRGL